MMVERGHARSGASGPERIIFVLRLAPLPLLDAAAAAKRLGLRRHTLACYRSRGDGPAYYKFGRSIRYAPADLRRWAAAAPAAGSGLRSARQPSDCVQLVDTAMAARFLTVTRFSLRNYRQTGGGPPIRRLGRRVYYAVDELRAWAERQRRPIMIAGRS